MLRLFAFYITLCINVVAYSQIPQDSLLLYYPFNGNAEDLSSNNFDGTVNGANLVQDRFGNANSAYYFDGTNDYIELPNVSQLKPGLNISISFWAKLESLNQLDNQFFSTSSSSHYSGCTFNTTSTGTGGLNIGYGDNLGGSNSSYRRSKHAEVGFTIGSWYHIVGIFRGPTDMDIYVDGVLYSGFYSGTGGSIGYSNVAGAIGKASPIHFYWGTLDDFAYYNKSLTYCEVQELYNEGSETVDEITSCNSLIWIDGNTYTSDDSTSTYTLTNSFGCDSTIRLDLDIVEINTQITQVNNQLEVNHVSGATYQWFLCVEGSLTPVFGATSHTFTPPNQDLYSVTVSYLDCEETSTCFPYKNISIEEIDAASLSIIHRLENEIIEINFGENILEADLSIYTISGTQVAQQRIRNKSICNLSVDNLHSGVYMVSVKIGKQRVIKKVVLY